jgi:hypothetical protein
MRLTGFDAPSPAHDAPGSQRNLAEELLQKLLSGELATRRRKNVVQARSFEQTNRPLPEARAG